MSWFVIMNVNTITSMKVQTVNMPYDDLSIANSLYSCIHSSSVTTLCWSGSWWIRRLSWEKSMQSRNFTLNLSQGTVHTHSHSFTPRGQFSQYTYWNVFGITPGTLKLCDGSAILCTTLPTLTHCITCTIITLTYQLSGIENRS